MECMFCDTTRTPQRIGREYYCETCGKSWAADDGVPLDTAATPATEARSSSPSILDLNGNIIDGP